MTWESDLVASLSPLSSTEKIQKLLNELEVNTGKKHLFLMGLFEKMINEMSPISAVKHLSMSIRELDDPHLLAMIAKSLLRSIDLSSSHEVHPFTYLVNACPQILPYILSDTVRAVNKYPSLINSCLPFLAFVVSMDWTSPLSNSREIVEAIAILRESCGPVELAALLSECIKRIELDGYSPVNTVNLAISKISKCSDIKSSEPAFMLLIDSLMVFCKENEENILPLLLDIASFVPVSLGPFYSCLLCSLLRQETCSVALASEILMEAQRLAPQNPWINLVKFYLGLTNDILCVDTPPVYSPVDLVPYFESDELRVLTKYLKVGEIPFVDDDSFSSTLSLFHWTQSMLTGTHDLSAAFLSIMITLSAYHDEIKLLLVHCFKKRPAQFKALLRILIHFGATSESNKTFALGLVSSFLRLSRLRLVALPILCDELQDHAYLFSSIQATLPILPTSSSKSAQLLFAICVLSVVQADSRQGHLNFSFTCVKEFFKAKDLCVEAVGIMLEVLDALCAIRYVDPKVVWNNVVKVHAIPLIEKNSFVRALCCPLASKAILSHKLCTKPILLNVLSNYLAIDEPVPNEVVALFTYITDALFCTREEMAIEAASDALLQLDPLLFPDWFPTSHALVQFMQRFEFKLQDDSQFVLLLKRLLDKEISDMPRSMFLGTSNKSAAKTDTTDDDNELIQKLRDKTAAEWPSSPYMLEPYLRLELISLSPEIPVESAESILTSLLKLPSLMQLHWSTRLVILDHLTKLFTELVAHLNAHGHLGAVASRLKDRSDVLVKSGSSPAQVSCGILCRTALELALSKVHKDSRFVAWAKELKEPKGKYDQSEEVEAAVLLCLWRIHKIHQVIEATMFKSNTSWLSIVSSLIATDTGLVYSNDPLSCPFDMELLESFSKKPKLTPSDVQQAQALIVAASKIHNPTESILETCMSLHSTLLMSEPADLKNLSSIYISRICHRLPEDIAEVWLKHLIGKLEKPAPAIVKSDAAIALTELLFGTSTGLIERVPSSFFAKIVPTLVSACTDSRVSSWYINLLACKHEHRSDPSSPVLEATENRFGKAWAFGQLLAGLSTSKNSVKSQNQLTVLTSLKILPRFEWDQLLARFPSNMTVPFVGCHVVTKLVTGGTFISPGLLKLFKENVSSKHSEKLAEVIPFLEIADREYIVKVLLREDALLSAFELFSRLYSGKVAKPTFLDQTAIDLLSDPSTVKEPKVYQLASLILDLDTPNVVCTFLQLLQPDLDMKRIVALIRDPSLYQYGFLELVTQQLSKLPPNSRTDLLVKILELALIENSLEEAMYELFTGLVHCWLDPVHRALFSGDSMGVVYRIYEEMRVEFEDWRRLGKRFAQLGPHWDSFKRHPSLLSHILQH